MSDPFLGEVRMFGGNFAPVGWALCNGQLLSIAENDALYALIGTTYGGDGQNTFGVPDLRGRIPLHFGQGGGLAPRNIGETGGAETVTLTLQQLPSHNHAAIATTAPGSLPSPAGGMPATPAGGPSTSSLYVVPGSSTVVPGAMAASSIGATGGSQPHANMAPFLCVTFIICLQGIFPSRN